MSKNSLIFCCTFVLFLTVFVLINKELFSSCMCFGTLIDVKPGLPFIFKNSMLLISILIFYVLSIKLKRC